MEGVEECDKMEDNKCFLKIDKYFGEISHKKQAVIHRFNSNLRTKRQNAMVNRNKLKYSKASKPISCNVKTG